jgi:hypothetical protein
MSPLFVDRAALFAELPAIRQQPSHTSPQAAPGRFDAICLLTSADRRIRVGTGWGVSGGLVNGMQGVRGSNPLSSTTGPHGLSAVDRPRIPAFAQQIRSNRQRAAKALIRAAVTRATIAGVVSR